LCELLSCSFVVFEEFGADRLNSRAPQAPLSAADDGTCSAVSVRTSRSAASSKYSTTQSTARFEGFELKRAHYQSAIAKDAIPEDEATSAGQTFKLKTLDEHRYATRFQERKVTAKTWRSALRQAHTLIESGDRVNAVAALYLLLEIIWLAPQGCNLATMYLDSGSIYLAFDHLEEAAKAYRNSLRLDPSSWKARYNLGVTTARLQDFVEATRQLKLAVKECPGDIAEEVNSILQEIQRIQREKNWRAFNDTKKARTFTMQYLESLRVASVTSNKPRTGAESLLHEDHTVSHRNGLALTSATPQLLDASNEWQGSLASLLHRLHAFARCRHLSIQDEMRRLYPSQGGMSVQAFDEVAKRITGEHLSTAERRELAKMLGDDGYAYDGALALCWRC
jgi:tetratricopeptide (TPR) repeat protein